MTDEPSSGAAPGRAVVRIGEEALASLLCLPAGMRVRAVSTDFVRTSVVIVVESADLPATPEGGFPPELGGMFAAEYLYDEGSEDERRVWVRWHWRPDSDAGPPSDRYACGFAQCRESGVFALATRTRRDVTGPEEYHGVLMLCDEHSSTAPDSWNLRPADSAESG